MHNKEENVNKTRKKVQLIKKITSGIPQDLHQEFLQLVLDKHKSIYGHFNEELVLAIRNHLENERAKKKK